MRPPPPPHRRPPLCVLVVDDSPDARSSLRQLLGIWGHPVCEAADADEALRLTPAFRPDVALVAVALPGSDGREGVAAVALSGPSDAGELARAFQVGTRHYLTKPVEPTLLRRALGTIRGQDDR